MWTWTTRVLISMMKGKTKREVQVKALTARVTMSSKWITIDTERERVQLRVTLKRATVTLTEKTATA